MNQAITMALPVLGLIIALMIYEMPFIYDTAYTATMELSDDPLIITVSDLHLESNTRDLTCIGNYIRGLNHGNTYLIINGDLFDKAHKQELNQSHIRELINRLDLAGINGLREVIYITAIYDHDPRTHCGETTYTVNGIKVRVIRGIAKLIIGSNTIWFLHGDYIVKNGLIASLMNRLLGGSYDRLVRSAIGAREGDWVVIGHTHVPGINSESRIANTGSWINRFINAANTAVIINGLGGVELVRVKCVS
ncbi:hypothetical protein [Vulcanisaeta sp. JCM 14467]|uniref:hypothetical protein n=1 Tax=Vulcanisaeta sp. JCM 14467 TaxID=1295370 RepID=UPI0006D17CAC|nr:hypothetical protein [Vulcanisaeta sp. JCM 14467]